MTFKEFNQIFISLNKLFFFSVFIYDQKAVSVTKAHFEITQVKYTFYIYTPVKITHTVKQMFTTF